MKLRDIVVEQAIRPSLTATDRDGVVAELVDALVEAGVTGSASRDDLVKSVLAREEKGSTGFGKGVAVPHVKHSGLEGMAGAIGLSQAGIDFAALDKQPVYVVFVLLSPDAKPEDHLHAMEVIFRNLSLPNFRRFLRQATTVEEVMTLLDEADDNQLGG
ncbi:MAG: PTS sugar transporter subunit IIA [Planctomycetota bacterium]